MRVLRSLLAFAIPTALVVVAVVWLADRPGSVTIHWEGWRIDTTVPVLGLGTLLFVVLVLWLDRIARRLWSVPARWLAARRQGRQRRGYLALTNGLAAVAGGDAKTARKLARDAGALLGDAEVTGLLAAQAAHLDGDAAQAERHYHDLIERPETALSGLRGMLDLALARNDAASALDWAKRAWATAKGAGLGDLAVQLFELEARAGQWQQAESTVMEAKRRKALAPAQATALQAVALTEQAGLLAKGGDPSLALSVARKALKLQPGFVPACTLAATLLAAKNDRRGAQALLANAWAKGPHPDLARVWAGLWSTEPPLERLTLLTKAMGKTGAGGRLVLAQAALDARIWGQARAHLEAALQDRATEGVYRLLAQLERLEFHDEAKAMVWEDLARAAPVDGAWACASCGHSSDGYQAVCGHCGHVGTVAWGQS